ncbi:hypothetical protein BD311DRAFT_760198 [Dichomitus squalens]|uniref:Peptidase A1 domain-containing protein n=1 Tax=Dichomitus squalens TaxID=114155 RepID=A0A4Q9MIZ2_9APHY|nr:hypothetical protein BD311DRAFT_760198 [Dichomitus squalens]
MDFIDSAQWSSQSWERQLKIYAQIGVAYAVTDSFYRLGIDGIIGFGPSEHQTHWETMVRPNSILRTLQGADGLLGVDSLEAGIIVYCAIGPFAARREGRIEINPGASWISLNKWPLRDPTDPCTPDWSPRIPILDQSGSERPTWTIRLLSMEFYEQEGTEWKSIEGGKINLEGGLQVILDSGHSVSWVPDEVIRCLREVVFPCAHNDALEERRKDAPVEFSDVARANSQTSDYNYSVSGRNPRRTFIKYEFWAGDGKTRGIVVHGPTSEFVWGLKPRHSDDPVIEGLLFNPPPTSLPPGTAIWGINFFQSMFVALHMPEVQSTQKAYVRLAPQWPSERTKYGLPPLDW